MHRDRPDCRILLALAAFLLAGCAEQPPESQPVAAPADSEGVTDAPDFARAVPEPSDAESGAPAPAIDLVQAEVGAHAPDFEATGLDGETVSLADYIGDKAIVLAFSRAHW